VNIRYRTTAVVYRLQFLAKLRVFRLNIFETNLAKVRKQTYLIVGHRTSRVNYLGMEQPPRSTQPCISPGSLNRVPASAGVKAGKPLLPGGR